MEYEHDITVECASGTKRQIPVGIVTGSPSSVEIGDGLPIGRVYKPTVRQTVNGVLLTPSDFAFRKNYQIQ
jgi:hypothetical protein